MRFGTPTIDVVHTEHSHQHGYVLCEWRTHKMRVSGVRAGEQLRIVFKANMQRNR
jgi:hypothetical protein